MRPYGAPRVLPKTYKELSMPRQFTVAARAYYDAKEDDTVIFQLLEEAKNIRKAYFNALPERAIFM